MQHNFLPIAERELRAAARHRNTHRLRWATCALAIVISVIWLVSKPRPALAAKFVGSVFALQTVCAFGFALLVGAFLISDCLSEEKRDGTLSLLFLTGMKPGEIVVGKFLGISLSATYGLLGLLPVMALPILLGGVEFVEFCRTALALVNTLFFSMALGLAVSAFVTDYARGLAASLGLLVLFGAVLPALAEVVSAIPRLAAWSGFGWLSPFYPFWYAGAVNYALAPLKFWIALLASHLLGWAGLGLATIGLRRSWGNLAAGADRLARSAASRAKSRRKRAAADTAFDPVVRLAGNAPLFRWIAWLIVVVWGALLCANRFWPSQLLPDLLAASFCAFLLKALIAFQACRFFVETRRNGALELLLCTPLRNADLINAQWRALLRVFAWPLLAFLLLSWVLVPFPPHAALPVPGASAPNGLPNFKGGFLGTFFLTIGLAADILATGWFGMWLALTVRKPGLAPGLTVLAVLILPALLSHFSLVADMLFISWGTTRFQEEFRWVAATRLPSAAARG